MLLGSSLLVLNEILSLGLTISIVFDQLNYTWNNRRRRSSSNHYSLTRWSEFHAIYYVLGIMRSPRYKQNKIQRRNKRTSQAIPSRPTLLTRGRSDSTGKKYNSTSSLLERMISTQFMRNIDHTKMSLKSIAK